MEYGSYWVNVCEHRGPQAPLKRNPGQWHVRTKPESHACPWQGSNKLISKQALLYPEHQIAEHLIALLGNGEFYQRTDIQKVQKPVESKAGV